ncbi:hypothetical protein C7M84_001967 [Penaeus vannamei]|uniref:Uncharacterized protein n=1 Tax=Penaeus vannamei TaxID=6689 RepID=A0A423TS78_PENVA|nr:hypothetical protein C7M84_001967 [Penaeus vannamei]
MWVRRLCASGWCGFVCARAHVRPLCSNRVCPVNWSMAGSAADISVVCPSLVSADRLFLPKVFLSLRPSICPGLRSFLALALPTASMSTSFTSLHTCHPPPFLLPNVFVFAGCRFPPLQGPRPAFPSIMAVYLCSPRPNSPGCGDSTHVLPSPYSLPPSRGYLYPIRQLRTSSPTHPPPLPSRDPWSHYHGTRFPSPSPRAAFETRRRNTHTAKTRHRSRPELKTKSKQRLAASLLLSAPLPRVCHESPVLFCFFLILRPPIECCAEHPPPLCHHLRRQPDETPTLRLLHARQSHNTLNMSSLSVTPPAWPSTCFLPRHQRLLIGPVDAALSLGNRATLATSPPMGSVMVTRRATKIATPTLKFCTTALPLIPVAL